MRKPLILTYNPVIAPLCAALPHSHIIYHCVDDLRASPHIDPHVITLGEKMLSEVADLCFTTAPELQKRMQSLFSRTVYEPNVCDYKMFRTARDKNLTEPADMAAIPHPRALFVGALSEYKVDFKLMEAVARRMPHVHWVLIGPEGEGQPDSRRAPHLPNIHMLGHRPYAGLPSYMAHAQVAVLPAMHNAYTASMFPMKFFEFLAAGLPLVSTRLPALHAFENLCWLADGEENFCASLRDVLDGKRKDAKAIDAACRYHSWSARFERMQTALRELDGSAPAQNVQNSFASKERV